MTTRSRRSATDQLLPDIIPVFPLYGAVLLPRGQMPLNIFEPRYLEMVDDVLAGERIIGMIQPQDDGSDDPAPVLRTVGCAGRVTTFSETDDSRYLITLTGLARFALVDEVAGDAPYRLFRIRTDPFTADFVIQGENEVDRDDLLSAFRAYLDANDLDIDWDTILRAPTEWLVNAAAMFGPYGPAEKQALLEAPDLKTRAETVVALTEMTLARGAGHKPSLQ